jgi:hypothetical protein
MATMDGSASEARWTSVRSWDCPCVLAVRMASRGFLPRLPPLGLWREVLFDLDPARACSACRWVGGGLTVAAAAAPADSAGAEAASEASGAVSMQVTSSLTTGGGMRTCRHSG